MSEFTHHMKEAMIVSRRIMKVTPNGENPPLDRIERVALSLVNYARFASSRLTSGACELSKARCRTRAELQENAKHP